MKATKEEKSSKINHLFKHMTVNYFICMKLLFWGSLIFPGSNIGEAQ